MIGYVVGIGIAAVAGCQIWMFRAVTRRLAALERFESRLVSVAHTLTLLADTTETGFQSIATELAQQRSVVPAPRASAKSSRQRRVVNASHRGQSVSEIASLEEVAESEVRLRLFLADQSHAQRSAHGSLHE
jgi:hypothetical protein